MFLRRYFHPQMNVSLECKSGWAGPDRNLFQQLWRCLMLKQGQHVVMLLWYPLNSGILSQFLVVCDFQVINMS